MQTLHRHIGTAIGTYAIAALFDPPQGIAQPAPFLDIALCLAQIKTAFGFDPRQIGVVTHATEHIHILGGITQFRCNFALEQP